MAVSTRRSFPVRDRVGTVIPAGCSSQRGLAAARLLLLGATLHCVCLSGCVSGPRRTMTQFLPSVAQTWWPGTREEPDEETKPAEPSVTANVAVVADSSETDSDNRQTSVVEAPATSKRERGGRASSSSGSVTAQSGGRVASPPLASEQKVAARDPVEAAAINSSSGEGDQDQLERLKAALSEDARRNTEPNRTAGSSGDARLRVDSLLGRARRLFDVGQFSEARQTAQFAQELGETARLDYSPDEERPIDLVHRIDDQLQSMPEPSDETGTENSNVVDTERPKTEELPSAEPKTTAVESSGNRSWLLGRGMNVFRRDRKPVATDAVIAPAAADNAQPQVTLSLEVDDNAKANTDSRTAVVQANRSVALSTVTSPQRTPREAIRTQVTDHSDVERSRHPSQPSDELGSEASEFPEDGQRAATTDSPDRSLDNPANFSSDDGPQLTTDNTATPPPVLEDVRPVSPFRNVAGQTKTSHASRSEHTEPRGSVWGWAIGAACLMACSLLALACYRRGAT